MYVCLCHGITERQIYNAVAEQGVATFEHLQAELGVATCCGQCRQCATLVLAAARAASDVARSDTSALVATRLSLGSPTDSASVPSPVERRQSVRDVF